MSGSNRYVWYSGDSSIEGVGFRGDSSIEGVGFRGVALYYTYLDKAFLESGPPSPPSADLFFPDSDSNTFNRLN